MALSSSLIAFVLSHLLIFLFALGENKTLAKCTESFGCGSLGVMSFPLTKFTEPNCGLCLVDCDAKPSPKIRLSSDGELYDLLDARVANTTKIRVPRLENKSCWSFSNLSLPNTASISFTVFPNITLFKCSTSSSNQSLDHNFAGYEKFTDCGEEHGFNVWYNYSLDPSAVGTLPDNCSIIQLPIKPFDHQHLDTPKDLYNLLASEFDLEWHLSADCYDCHQRGGQCQTESENRFHCKEVKGSSKLGLILGTVLAGVAAILIICLVIFIIWRRRRKSNDSSYILSRITSSDPSSRTDLEASSVYPGVPVFSYAELVEATSNFDSSKELGDGGFGIVYYGKLRDGREVAVKRLYEHNYKRVEQFMNEIKILTGLRHRNLVSLYGCTSRRSRELLLVYEYVHNGTVADHLHGERGKEKLLTWPIRMNIAFETASALTYLHASDIIHRDVKTNNILLDHNFCVKVADFGLSRLFPNDVTHVSTAPQGTPGYVDPEYFECYQLTNKSDVYSFGVVLIELISSLPAVDISRHRQEINLANLAINRIQSRAYDELIDPSLGYTSDPEVKRMTISIAELAFQCLQVDKELRPKMDEVLEVLKDIKEAKEDFQVLES